MTADITCAAEVCWTPSSRPPPEPDSTSHVSNEIGILQWIGRPPPAPDWGWILVCKNPLTLQRECCKRRLVVILGLVTGYFVRFEDFRALHGATMTAGSAKSFFTCQSQYCVILQVRGLRPYFLQGSSLICSMIFHDVVVSIQLCVRSTRRTVLYSLMVQIGSVVLVLVCLCQVHCGIVLDKHHYSEISGDTRPTQTLSPFVWCLHKVIRFTGSA